MNKHYDSIYKYDSKGKPRVWYMEQEGSKHRTVAGVLDGKLVTAGWTQCIATNVGRSNERDPVAQATFEIEAEYEYKLKRDYHRTLEGAKGGAHFFEPMLADKYKDRGFTPGYAQPKLDGIRCIARANGLWSREGEPILGAPHIAEILQEFFQEHPDAILDGELYNHLYKDDFESIVSAVRKKKLTPDIIAKSREVVEYHVYDFPSVQDVFLARTSKLHYHTNKLANEKILYVNTVGVPTEDSFDELHGQWLEEGYEGSMLRGDTPYEAGKRSKYLLKRKEFIDEEFECVRIEEGLGNWGGLAKKVICRMPDGREFGAGIKGNQARAKDLLNEKHKIVTVRYFKLTKDGIPRFGVVTQFHGEKRRF